MKTIALIAGTRPEIIKLLPVYLALKGHDAFKPLLILTGQHRELAHDVLKRFHVSPDMDMDVMEPGQTLVSLTGKLTERLASWMKQMAPDAVLVQGDTTSAMLGGLLGFYQNIPVGHVEAGLRTGNLRAPYPEEFNRRVLSLAAHWHFAPTKTAADNLAREGLSANVHIVGNTVIDAALMMATQETDAIALLRARFPFLASDQKNTVLVTAHRRENFGAGIHNIAEVLRQLASQHPMLNFILPAHPNPNVRPVFVKLLSGVGNIHIIEPVGYDELLFLIRQSRLILTDSGGIQEEAPAFHVPVLVLREETERPEGIEAGCSKLVGTNTQNILAAFNNLITDAALYQRMASAPNPYGDGTAAKQIVEIISRDRSCAFC